MHKQRKVDNIPSQASIMLTPPQRTLSAPHRLGFLAGGLLLLACFLWWAFELGSRWRGVVLPQVIPSMFLHGYTMVYSFFPLFMLGFIYTAGPRWLGVPSPTRRAYAPVLLTYAVGGLLLLAARVWPHLLSLGLLCHSLGWAAALWIWLKQIKTSTSPDKKHAIVVATGFTLGWLGMLCALYWGITSDARGWLAAVNFGIWGLLLPVFLAVSHRMVPFFSGSVLQPYVVWRPYWLLYTLLGLSISHGALDYFQLNTAVTDLPFAALLLYTSWRWRLVKSFKVKLLAMLHAAFAWSGIALTLFVVHDGLLLAGQAGLGFAPLHALTLGFFTTMLLAFVTRVTLGHSGRPLTTGRLAWTCYWLMHGVTLARVLGELIPGWQTEFYLAAIGLGVISLASWSKVYLPMYWQARADGQAG